VKNVIGRSKDLQFLPSNARRFLTGTDGVLEDDRRLMAESTGIDRCPHGSRWSRARTEAIPGGTEPTEYRSIKVMYPGPSPSLAFG
jgi:hypothetical protein